MFAIIRTAIKRLGSNLWLALCAQIALIVAVALAVSVPLYAESASLRLLREEIAQQERQSGRSPFVLFFRYLSSSQGALEWERIKTPDEYLSNQGLASLNLGKANIARHMRTGSMRLFLPPQSGTQSSFLRDMSLGFISGLEPQMRIVDGTAPQPPSAKNQPIEVLLARSMADELGINVGESLNLVAAGTRPASLTLRVVGLWEPLNAADPAWFFAPDTLKDVLLTNEASFRGPVAETLRGEIAQALWYIHMNSRGLDTTRAAPLLSRIENMRTRAVGMLPGLRLESSPVPALTRYRENANALTIQLSAYSVSIIGLVLYFVAMVAGLLVARQRAEVALLKTRGVRSFQIVGLAVVEWSLLGLIALAAGPWLGLRFAQLMSRTTSFLTLSSEAATVPIGLSWRHLGFGLAAVVLAMLAALIPITLSARRSLADEYRQIARQAQPPLWQRFYLDIALFLLPCYGIFQMQRSGGLQLGSLRGADPFSNPLLLLVPVLLCFSLGLITLRLSSTLLDMLASLASIPSWVTPLVALRALARQPGAYRGALLLLILTLSLAIYSASMAATIDGALRRSVSYKVGAATQLIETGQTVRRSNPSPGQLGRPAPTPAPGAQPTSDSRFLFVPVDTHLKAPGVQAATRVGSYDGRLQAGGTPLSIQVIGIDRLTFPRVVREYRRTWASGLSLGDLMNTLAQHPDGILVSRNMLREGIKVGDRIPVQLIIAGDQQTASFRIVGVVDLWPGFYPQDMPFAVANLDYVFDQMGAQYPYDVWIARDSQAKVDDVVAAVRRLNIQVLDRIDASETLLSEQTNPRRQSVFGMLSVGFLTSSVLTLIGFLVASVINARRRLIDLGVLRALGIHAWQMGVALCLELGMVLLLGLGAGTGIGLLAALLVVPQLQSGIAPYPGTPPYPARIAWDQIMQVYGAFGIALAITLLVLVIMLSRMRLFQTIKLGDAN